MARLLLIAACCMVAAISLLEIVEGQGQSFSVCEKRCKRSCFIQNRQRTRQLKPCYKKCEKQAKTCADCTSPRKCLVCLPGYTLFKNQCYGGPPVGPPLPTDVPPTVPPTFPPTDQPPTPSVKCLANIQVLYTNNNISQPCDLIYEVHGKNNSISEGFNGPIVWLVAVWQSSTEQAVTGINITVTGDEAYPDNDLGYRDGSDYYRYLDLFREETGQCINEVALWRADDATTTPDPAEWDGYSSDLNDLRDGTYLYLAWNYAN